LEQLIGEEAIMPKDFWVCLLSGIEYIVNEKLVQQLDKETLEIDVARSLLFLKL